MTIQRIQYRRDSTANWAFYNPVLAVGEPAFDYETEEYRLGNGVTNYLDLVPYTPGGGGGGGVTLEQVQDDLGNTSLLAGTSLTKVYDDNAGTITLNVDAADFATAAQGTTADAAVPKTVVDAKGDLLVASAADTVTKLTAGTNGHVLTADSGEATGVKWAASAGSTAQTINPQTGTTYTFVIGDENNIVTATNGSPQTYTVPPNASVAFEVGSSIDVISLGVGAVTIAAGSGVTITPETGSSLVLAGAGAAVNLLKIATDTWSLVGNLIPSDPPVLKSLYDANSILIATSDNTPIALTVAASRVVGRKASGDIDDMSGAEAAAILAGEVFKQAQEVNAQTGTTYTLVAGDAGKLVTLSNGSAITLTLPQDSDATIAVGTYVDLYQLGAGQVTVAAGTGATLRTSGLTAKARAQYSRLGVQKVSANTWSLYGDLAAS